MEGPLGGLARQKWAASQARAAAVAAIAQARASSSSVFAEYGSDNEPEHAVSLAAVAGYGSGSDSEPAQTETRATVAGYGSGGPASVHNEGGGPAQSAVPSDNPRESRSTQSDAADGSTAAKRRRLLPSSCTALVDARPAAEDRLAQQPKEPSREEKKAELNAEQARRIEELFFWCERMHAREATIHTPINLQISLSLSRGKDRYTHNNPSCNADANMRGRAQERRLFKGPKLRVIKGSLPWRTGVREQAAHA
jgi:hypothetical protein